MNDKSSNQPSGETTPPATDSGADKVLDIRIEKLVTGGAGLGRLDGQAVFVPLTAPGDQVRVEVVRRKKGFIQGNLVEVLEAGPDRQEPPCPHYGQCGGCDLQHMTPASQRQAKTDIVIDCFQRLGKMDVSELLDAPAQDSAELGYRNRIRVTANPMGQYGLLKRGTHDVIPLQSCALLPEQFNTDILPWLRMLPPVEQIVIRLDGQGGWLLSLYGPPNRMRVMKKIIAAIPVDEAPAPGCVGLMFNNLPLWGRDHLIYSVADHKYRVSAQAFFQGNLATTEEAMALARSWIDELKAADTLGSMMGDLYCGVGLFSLAFADAFETVVAIDSDPYAIRDAINNVKRDAQARDKVTVHKGDVNKMLAKPDLASDEQWQTSCCLLDPPRVGLGKEGLAALLQKSPRHLIIMSCDPATMARDTAALVAEGYVLKRLKVLDMFPQTAHIETLMLLEKTS